MAGNAPLCISDARASVHFRPTLRFVILRFFASRSKLTDLAIFSFSMTIGALPQLPPNVSAFPSAE
jgi:hypothetical protein